MISGSFVTVFWFGNLKKKSPCILCLNGNHIFPKREEGMFIYLNCLDIFISRITFYCIQQIIYLSIRVKYNKLVSKYFESPLNKYKSIFKWRCCFVSIPITCRKEWSPHYSEGKYNYFVSIISLRSLKLRSFKKKLIPLVILKK